MLFENALKQLEFFTSAINPSSGFFNLDRYGRPLEDGTQELHAVTRMVHSFVLGRQIGFSGGDFVIEQGMRQLLHRHRDKQYGGFVWSTLGNQVVDGRKLAYGHAFVLLAASSAMTCGHPNARVLLDETMDILETRFWEPHGLFADEWNRDWPPFFAYRGMNANMHAVEAMLTAFEVTGDPVLLQKARRILEFFIGKICPDE